MEKSQPNDSRDLKKITTRRLKLGIKFGKDADGGIEAGLACGYEKKIDRVFGPKNLSPIHEENDEQPDQVAADKNKE